LGKGTRYPFVEKYLSDVIKSGDLVIETGCGGAMYRDYITTLGGFYIGCDVPNLLYQDSHDVDVYCSGDALPFKKEISNLIFNQGAFDYMPNPTITIQEAYRVTGNGGLFTIFTYRKDVLEKIDRNCRERKRDWELNHHVYSGNKLQNWLNNNGFVSNEITRKLDTINSKGLKRQILDFLRLYKTIQSRLSIWRVYEAKK
jgi:SAM-dependent methyltransferase